LTQATFRPLAKLQTVGEPASGVAPPEPEPLPELEPASTMEPELDPLLPDDPPLELPELELPEVEPELPLLPPASRPPELDPVFPDEPELDPAPESSSKLSVVPESLLPQAVPASTTAVRPRKN
jgi:hypothetical protein